MCAPARDFEVQVRAAALAGRARHGNLLSRADAFAGADRAAVQMRIQRAHAVVVLDDNHLAVACAALVAVGRYGHLPGSGRKYRGAT